ncbi:major capsid protein P2 [Pseudomonadota bacterium]
MQAKMNAVMQAIKGLYNPMPLVLDPFKVVGYGKPAVLELGENVTYASLEIITNLPADRISRISLMKGGREFSGWPATLFHVRDRYLKNTVDNTQTRIFLDFADENLRTTTSIRRGELVIGNGEKFTLKLQIESKQEGDPEQIELECHARELPAQGAMLKRSCTAIH